MAALQSEEAIASNPAQKFELSQLIADAKAKLEELENDASSQSPIRIVSLSAPPSQTTFLGSNISSAVMRI